MLLIHQVITCSLEPSRKSPTSKTDIKSSKDVGYMYPYNSMQKTNRGPPEAHVKSAAKLLGIMCQAHLKIGRRPNNATKVTNEMDKTIRATSLITPISPGP
jgi:hypothetical protein